MTLVDLSISGVYTMVGGAKGTPTQKGEQMVTVSTRTQKGRDLLGRAIHYEGYYLDDVYGSVSKAKSVAWRECLAKCEEEGGDSFRICSHNGFRFSVSWRVSDGWRMETADNSYHIVDDGE